MKRFSTGLILLFLMCSVSWGATTEIDPFNLHFWYTSPDYEAQVYGTYGSTDYNFFYQLRDVTGASRQEHVAGSQWFATVYENYYYGIRENLRDETYRGIYRRTMGGEIPDITIQTVGDLIDGFNFVFAEEPQPYASAWRSHVNNQVYDVYPDPLETLCLVITNGQADFNISFGNPYARHFPFWWYLTSSGSQSGTSKWWLQAFDWRKETYPTQEPIAYIYSSPYIYVRNNSIGRFEKIYELKTSDDKYKIVSADSSFWIYTISGDAVYTSADNVLTWSFNESRDKVYDASGNLAYTIETDSVGDMFICEIRTINESITFSGFDEDYTFNLTPSGEQSVASGSSLNANVRVRGLAGSDYGSKLGYLTFRQRASFAQGYSNYREYSTLPLVIANVAQGNASITPLIFDMIVTDANDDVVNRIKFTWDVQSDNLNQDFGTFFMIGSRDVTYKLETRITNRTGTRYELYRYDMMGSRTSNPNYRDNHSSIMPDHWMYDLTQDMYGTLPDSFLLDAHSQIAPGLVTVYKNNIGEGYSTINTGNDTAESFRLTEYSDSAPKNLRLNYRRIGGMTPLEDGTHVPESGVKVQEFSMVFADVANNSDQTSAELTSLMGKYPSMAGLGPLVNNPDLSLITGSAASDAAEVKSVYVNSSAVDAFSFVKSVPAELVRLVSQDDGSDTTSNDQSGSTSNDVGTQFYSSAIVYTSVDIPVLPLSIRMRVPRNNQIIVNHWEELNNATSGRDVFNIFAKYGSVWLRSDATSEKDADLFTAVNNKGSNQSVGAVDCFRAFICDDELYLDFIVLLADGKSTKSGRTAYVEVFKDDNVPYILVGDGKENAVWDMIFYIAPANTTNSNSNSGGSGGGSENENNGTGTPNNSSSGGGGGCNSALSGTLILAIIASITNLKKNFKKKELF